MTRATGRRLPAAVAALAVLGAVLALLAAAVQSDDRETTARGTAAEAGATAPVERRTLVDRESVEGTLRYAGARAVLNRLAATGGEDAAGGAGAGGGPTLTRTARAGSVVRRGGALYWADDEPVVLMYGSTPAYRTLAEGVADGPDVAQLEANLAALGFDPGTVDGEFTEMTAEAVRAWQEAADLAETGRVELGRVVFLPGPRRIGARSAAVGQPLADGQEVVETTSTRRVVTVELEAAKQALVRRGDRVLVTLPNGSTVRGRVTHVGRVARAKSGGDGGGLGGDESSGADDLVVDVTVKLRSTRGAGRLDQAPVTVAIASERSRNALVVPVSALLARPGGGYAVQLPGGRLVGVRPGLFADGMVEVSSGRLRPGMRVVVPE